MRLAVIDDDQNWLDVYKDLLRDFNPNCFDDPNKFLKIGYHVYDYVIVDHRFKNCMWDDIVIELKPDVNIIVTTTFPKKYYKNEFPELFYNMTEKIKELRNVVLLQKDDTESIYRKIKNANKIKMLENSLLSHFHRS